MGIITTDQLVHEYIRRDENGDEIGREQALRGVSIDIPAGSFIAVLGANGSGKSTFAKHLNALLNPTSGTVIVNGLDTRKEENQWDIRKSAGMVFQNPDNQIVATVVEEDVAFGPENLGVKQEELQGRVDEALKKVGMFEYRYHSPNRLSGGQKQRVAVAGIMAMRPSCIIMDEPTAMLDPNGRKEVIDTVHQLNKEEGITVILITHYMDEVVGADYIYVMDHGEVAMEGTPREIFTHVKELSDIRLSVPCATELCHRLREAGISMELSGVLTSKDFVNAYRNTHFTDLSKESIKNPNSAENALKSPNTVREEGASGDGEHLDNNEVLLELQNVCYTYSEGTTYEKKALKNMNLKIHEGEFVGLIGHTGSGKSTLIQHLNGLVKPTSGKVMFKGEDIHGEKYSKKALRSNVGLVFQYPEYQLFEATVLKDVCFGPKNLGLSQEEAEKKAKEALALVHIDETMYNSNPLELSGGQKRRVAIAGVLAMSPKVLVLDEPTAGLDPVGHDEILQEINHIHEETGMTVVLVSHSMEDVAEYADRVVVMSDGECKLYGTPQQVFRNVSELESMGLAAPQVSYIMQMLHAEGLAKEAFAITLDQAVNALLSERRETR